jgi:hypothetical protein
MPTPRYSFATVQVPDGRVFAIGGWLDGGLQDTTVVEVYSPATNTWDQSYPPLPGAAAEIGGAVGHDGGLIYVVGCSPEATAVMTYPTTSADGGTWNSGTPLAVGQQAAAVFADGSNGLIYVIGGYGVGVGAGTSTVEALDTFSDNWSSAFPQLPDMLGGASGAAAPDGTLYIVGTYNNAVFSLSDGGWSKQTLLAGRTVLNGAATAIDASGNFWVLGGWNVSSSNIWDIASDVVPDVFLVPPTSTTAAPVQVTTQLPTPRAGLGAFFGVGPDGQTYLYAIGGVTDAGSAVGTVEAYSVDAGFW